MKSELEGTILAVSTRFPWSGDTPRADCLEPSYPEMLHYGWALVLGKQRQILWQTEGAAQASSFFRSSAKPFQAIPLLDYGAPKSLQLEEIAIACASHSGTQEHLTWAKHLLARLSGEKEPLRCGAQMPVDANAQRQLWISHEEMTAFHNNCSGKHAAMLWVCEQAGWSKHQYWHPEHPLQKSILGYISQYGQISIDDIGVGLDGCGIPTFYLPLLSMAHLYLSLMTEKKLRPIVEAMQQYPNLVAGPGRIDTALMKAVPNDLISKVGADGLICIASCKREQVLVLKLADGNNAIRDKVVVQLLLQLGWLAQESVAKNKEDTLKPFLDTLRYNTLNEVVGDLVLKVQAKLA